MQVANRVFLADKRVIPSSGRGKSSTENDPFKILPEMSYAVSKSY